MKMHKNDAIYNTFLHVPTVPMPPLVSPSISNQPPMSASASLPSLFSHSSPFLPLTAPATTAEPPSPMNEDEFELLHPPTSSSDPINQSTRYSTLTFLATLPLPT